MNTQTAPLLDAEELLHFAIKASRNNENEKAILYLKHALTLEPENARILYFLGAQHAEIGMYERAIENISKAVKLDPSLDTAHFQLGLLYATSGRINEAKQAWQALDKLEPQHPLYLFKAGLLQLAEDKFKEAHDHLTQGIGLNKINPNLNNDMQKILTSIEKVLNASGKTQDNKDTSTPVASGANHILLNAYNNDEDDTKKH